VLTLGRLLYYGKSRRRLKSVLATAVLILFMLISFLPIFWAVLMSLKTRVDALSMPPKWVFSPTLQNYRTVWRDSQFLSYAKDSLVIAIISTSLGMALGVPAAYALARYRIRGQNVILMSILSARMMPPVAFVIPFFVIFTRLSLRDTFAAVIIMHLSFILGFVIWMMRSYFRDIPKEMEEAALVDGCNEWQAFLKVMLPVAAPGLATSAVFAFIFSWNEFLYAMVLTTVRVKTLPLGLYQWVAYEEIMWGELTASAVLAMIPVMVFYLFVQKAMVRGLTMGAVKG
jgi:multiple sugar transport system permease protein